MTTPAHDDMHTCGHVDAQSLGPRNRPVTPRKPPQPVTAPEEWRVNLGRRTITHIQSGLVLKMRKGIERGEQMAIPTNLERMPRWGTRWPRALREAEALYQEAVATHRTRVGKWQGEGT